MRRAFISAVLASAAFAAFASAGEEPTKYDISRGGRWKVGQIATVTEHTILDFDLTMNGEPFKSERKTFDAAYVVRCDELHAKGGFAKRTVFVKSWKETEGDQTDESISGLRISVERGVWKLPEGKVAGPFAKKWLDKKFVKNDDDPFSKLAPPLMAVGQVWKPDSKTAADLFTKAMGKAPFEVTGVEMEVTLVSVDGAPPDAVGTLGIKMHVPIGGKLPGMPPEAVLAPGAVADVVGEAKGAVSGSTNIGSGFHIDMTMAMNIELNQNGQKTVLAMKGAGVLDKQTVPGGEIPEPAQDEPEKPDAEKPQAPAPAPDPK